MTRATSLAAALPLAAALCAGTLLPAGVLAAEAPAGTPEESRTAGWFIPVTVGMYFSCDIPADWSRDNGASGPATEDKNIYGISLHRPVLDAVPLRIAVHYYAAGNALYRSADDYIARHSRPSLGLTADNGNPATEIVVSGRTATLFERRRNEFVPRQRLRDEPQGTDGRIYEQGEIMPLTVPVIERFVVVPADSGFHALEYSAPAAQFAEFLPIFTRLTASFNALR